MRKTTLLGLMMALTLTTAAAQAQAPDKKLGVELSFQALKDFKTPDATMFFASAYKPIVQKKNWSFGPVINYTADVSKFSLFGGGNGFTNSAWSYGLKVTISF